MPITTYDYSKIEPIKTGINPNEIFSSILQGYNTAMTPQKDFQNMRGKEFENIIKEQEAKYAPQNAEYGSIIKKAEADYAERKQKAEVGEKEAKNKYWEQGGSRGGAGSERGAPNITKLQNAYDRAVEEFGEDSPKAQQIGLAIQKATSDVGQRKSALAFNNVIQSMNSANVDALTRYSGPAGQIEFRKQQAKDMFGGNASNEYYEHLEAVKAVKLEAQELRQALGTSITPSMDRALQEIVNSSSITMSPKAAKAVVLKSRGIIEKQAKNFQQSLNSRKSFTDKAYDDEEKEVGKEAAIMDKGSDADVVSGQLQQGPQKVRGTLNGKTFMIPADKIGEFQQAGGQING